MLECTSPRGAPVIAHVTDIAPSWRYASQLASLAAGPTFDHSSDGVIPCCLRVLDLPRRVGVIRATDELAQLLRAERLAAPGAGAVELLADVAAAAGSSSCANSSTSSRRPRAARC